MTTLGNRFCQDDRGSPAHRADADWWGTHAPPWRMAAAEHTMLRPIDDTR